jgi:hypothetical protein
MAEKSDSSLAALKAPWMVGEKVASKASTRVASMAA